jgi:uncharacterized protein (DUF2252 family)
MVRAYRQDVRRFSELPVLELARLEITPRSTGKPIAPVFRRAARNTPEELIRKATVREAKGFARFRSEPPLQVPLEADEARRVLRGLAAYRATLGAGRRQVFDAYVPWDLAFKVVGTGSVGVDDYLVLLYGAGSHDPLFLQVKEEDPSCWEPYVEGAGAHRRAHPHHGQRCAEGHLRTQTVVDPFLGWTRIGRKDFLVRQWSDHKASLDVDMLANGAMQDCAALCGEVLAKAHARTGDAAMLAGYCGASDRLDVAMADFALGYADQTEADYDLFSKAIRRGELKAARG